MNKPSRPVDIASSLKFLKKKQGLPPIHSWNPPFCGDIDMRISRDGQWHYNGSPIGREAMVKLFASVLRHDEDDCYYLVTPVEKVGIQVDDAPFVIVKAEMVEGDKGKEYLFTTNVGDKVTLDESHSLVMMEDSLTKEPAPYIRVRDRLDALINRNVFYQLVEEAIEVPVEGGVELVIISRGEQYSLGRIPK